MSEPVVIGVIRILKTPVTMLLIYIVTRALIEAIRREVDRIVEAIEENSCSCYRTTTNKDDHE
jgi:hypothetical protein